MKKNAMLKIAAILMVAVLLTTCAISSTFAKYVTDGTPVTETARVAKWGVTFTTKTNNLFLNTYNGEGDVSVKATGTTKVVAPGTTNTASVSTDIVGTPEVAFELITTATVDLGDNWLVDGSFYCPLVFKIGSGSEITSEGCADVAAFEKNINDAIKAAVTTPAKYAAGNYVATDETNPDDGNAFSITWSWPFETGADASAKATNNVKDTALGTAAAAEVTITVTQTAQQLDTYPS